MTRRLTVALAVLVGALVALAIAVVVTLHLMAPRLRAMVQDEARYYLQTHFNSSVQFQSLDVDFYPRVHIVVNGLVMRHNGRTDVPPLFEMRRVTFNSTLLSLLRKRPKIKVVQVEGLQINTPPRMPGEPPMFHGTDTNLAKKIPIVIGEIRVDNALITILRRDTKPPNQFQIHDLVMNNFGFDRPAAFHALLTNPKPHGDIHCDGLFGPWKADEPSITPVSAKYTFFNADLGTLKGLHGILSSVGTFAGPLDYLKVEGVTDTPDFALRTSSRSMALHTDFNAIVDGTNGNTVLTYVNATFLGTTIDTKGEVVDVYPKVKGRTIAFDAVSNNARIQDLLALAVKTDKPVMTGTAHLKAKILIPESNEDLVDRLQITGQFGLGKVHFTNPMVQGKIDTLSRKGRGRPSDGDIVDTMSNLDGDFTMADAKIQFSELRFGVEGASVALDGDYNVDDDQLDFRGKLRLDAKLSQTMTGWKSVLLRPFNPFFEGPHKGTVIPIKITGTKDQPAYGTDFHDKENRE